MRPDSRDHRGQLVIVTALVLATIFVALALVVNSAIYVENLSSRETGDTDETILATTPAFETVDDMLDRTNANHNASHTEATQNFTTMVDGWRNAQRNENAKGGAAFSVKLTDQTNGTHIRQTDQTRAFTDASGTNSNWSIAEDASGISDYQMTVNRESLYTDTGDLLTELLANSFSAHVTNTSGVTWELHVYENADNNVTVRTVLDGDEQTPCEVDAATVEIDLVAETVGGEPCPTLSFAEGLVGDIDIEYRDPDQIKGTYELRADRMIEPDTDSRYVAQGEGSPSATPNIYATAVQVSYTTADLSVQRGQRLAAGDAVYEQ